MGLLGGLWGFGALGAGFGSHAYRQQQEITEQRLRAAQLNAAQLNAQQEAQARAFYAARPNRPDDRVIDGECEVIEDDMPLLERDES